MTRGLSRVVRFSIISHQQWWWCTVSIVSECVCVCYAAIINESCTYAVAAVTSTIRHVEIKHPYQITIHYTITVHPLGIHLDQ